MTAFSVKEKCLEVYAPTVGFLHYCVSDLIILRNKYRGVRIEGSPTKSHIKKKYYFHKTSTFSNSNSREVDQKEVGPMQKRQGRATENAVN